ncbi:MAG: transcription-repair coupling factor, superfamily helicase, partial [Pseudomonadota bacterium]
MITFRHFLLSSAALVGALALSACSNPLGTHQPHFTGKLSGNQEVPATPSTGVGVLGACRTWNVESENRPQRGQFLPDLQAHSPAMGQKDGEKWT